MSPRYDTVLLDVDGTLVDSTYLHALAWLRAFRTIDEKPPWYRVHRTIGMGGDKLVGHVLGDEVEERHGDALRDRWEEEYAALVGEVPAFPGAAELVADVRRQRLRVALASSGAQRFTDDAMELLGVGADDVDAVTSADDADDSKTRTSWRSHWSAPAATGRSWWATPPGTSSRRSARTCRASRC